MPRSTRRAFLASVGAGTLAARAALSVPRRIQAFCIDFNWRRPRPEGWHNDFAKPGHWADASPEEHVAWYEGIGANTIQTFCVSTNGYAWYKGGVVPPQPGLKYDFLRRVAELGHRKKMLAMGYFCAGANTKWGLEHPDLSYGSPSDLHIPFTDEYIDYLCRSIEDAVRHTGIDGYMLDWLWNPNPNLRKSGWIASEQKLFEKLAGVPFPKAGQPAAADVLSYERAAIERCWSHVHEVTKSANRNATIWLSCSKLSDPTIAETRVLKQGARWPGVTRGLSSAWWDGPGTMPRLTSPIRRTGISICMASPSLGTIPCPCRLRSISGNRYRPFGRMERSPRTT
jgi:hypothetical protein